MNKSLLIGIAVGAGVSAAVSVAYEISSRSPHGIYELSYYSPRPPRPDETDYGLREGDPGAGFSDYDNAYILSLMSKCKVARYDVTYRLLPDGGRLVSSSFQAERADPVVTCLSKFIDQRSFLALQKVEF